MQVLAGQQPGPGFSIPFLEMDLDCRMLGKGNLMSRARWNSTEGITGQKCTKRRKLGAGYLMLPVMPSPGTLEGCCLPVCLPLGNGDLF